MSIGGATAQPASAKAPVSTATPEKISQKHMQFNNRTQEMSALQEAGQAGLSELKWSALKEPRLVSSIWRISSGFDSLVTTWTSVPESSLSDRSTRRALNKGKGEAEEGEVGMEMVWCTDPK